MKRVMFMADCDTNQEEMEFSDDTTEEEILEQLYTWAESQLTSSIEIIDED